jgi:hypothetical protein
MQTMASMEGQLASAGAAVDDRVLQTKMRGLDIETQTKLSNAESLKQLENSFAEYGRTEALAHQQRALRAEELKFQGNTQYADYIMNHPPTALADMWSLMISYATMPRSDDLGRAMLPGMRHKKQMEGEEGKENWYSRIKRRQSPYSF